MIDDKAPGQLLLAGFVRPEKIDKLVGACTSNMRGTKGYARVRKGEFQRYMFKGEGERDVYE